MHIEIHSETKKTCTKFDLKLLDINENQIEVPSMNMTTITPMPSSDFQRICRDMHNLADDIEIKSVGSQLIFNCKGDFASQETCIGEANSGMTFIQNQNPDEIVQGLFALKHLVLFSKCTNLCNSIELYLKNDYPLIIKYTVASLGSIKLCLAPKMEDS